MSVPISPTTFLESFSKSLQESSQSIAKMGLSTVQHLPGASGLIAGASLIINSIRKISEGSFSAAATNAVYGFTLMEVASEWNGISNKHVYMSGAVCTGAIAVACQGVKELYCGIRDRQKHTIVKGFTRLASGAGIFATAAQSGIKSTAIFINTLAISSCFAKLAYSGAKDIKDKNYLKGLGKLTIGIFGGAAAAISGYLAITNPDYIVSEAINASPKEDLSKDMHITIGSVYMDNGNEQVKKIAQITENSLNKYCTRWGLTCHHIVSNGAELADQCIDPRLVGKIDNPRVNCSHYWPKVPAMLDFFNSPPDPQGKKQYRMVFDYDSPITNHRINPYELVQQLQGSTKPSVILTQDSMQEWLKYNFKDQNIDPKHNLNGGWWLLENTAEGEETIKKLWETRNIPTGLPLEDTCGSLGMCPNQKVLHEQQGMVQVLLDNPELLEKGIVKIIPQRDPETGMGINTCTRRNHCYTRLENGFSTAAYGFQLDNPAADFQPGDFTAQPNGVPPLGQEGPLLLDKHKHCLVDKDIPISKVRLRHVEHLLEQTIE